MRGRVAVERVSAPAADGGPRSNRRRIDRPDSGAEILGPTPSPAPTYRQNAPRQLASDSPHAYNFPPEPPPRHHRTRRPGEDGHRAPAPEGLPPATPPPSPPEANGEHSEEHPDRKTTRKPPRRTMFGRFTERHPDESSFKPLESSSSSDSAFDGGPRFIPGRAGVTVGYLLPLGRELQFNFEEPPDTDTAECDRFHALMLLSCWEETIEAHERASYWIAKKEHEKEEKEGNAKLKGAVRAQGLALKLQAAKKKREENGGADGVRDSLIAPAARQSKATFPGVHDRV